MYSPRSGSADCPRPSSKSLGGMTVDLVEIGFAALYPRSASEPRREPEACGGRGSLITCEVSTGEGTGAGKACAHPVSRKNVAGEGYLILK
jgi:hypothetical protein